MLGSYIGCCEWKEGAMGGGDWRGDVSTRGMNDGRDGGVALSELWIVDMLKMDRGTLPVCTLL